MKPRGTGRCLDCDSRLAGMYAQRCRPCYRASKRRPHRCVGCGGPVVNVLAKRCLACHRRTQRRAERTCPDCGGPKTHQSAQCRACYIRTARDWSARLPGFDVDTFRAVVTRLQIGPTALAALSGVSRATIKHWLAGTRMPLKYEWERVRSVLAFDLCPTCHGSGTVDSELPLHLRLADHADRQRKRSRSA
jgi:hypothetical protein